MRRHEGVSIFAHIVPIGTVCGQLQPAFRGISGGYFFPRLLETNPRTRVPAKRRPKDVAANLHWPDSVDSIYPAGLKNKLLLYSVGNGVWASDPRWPAVLAAAYDEAGLDELRAAGCESVLGLEHA